MTGATSDDSDEWLARAQQDAQQELLERRQREEIEHDADGEADRNSDVFYESCPEAQQAAACNSEPRRWWQDDSGAEHSYWAWWSSRSDRHGEGQREFVF